MKIELQIFELRTLEGAWRIRGAGEELTKEQAEEVKRRSDAQNEE